MPKEGKEANLFYNFIPASLQEDSNSEEPTDEYQEEEIGVLFGGRDREETITHFWNTGYDVNNNNAPGLENMPTVSTTITPIPTSSECTFNDWPVFSSSGGYVMVTVTNTLGLRQSIPMTNPIRFLLGSCICATWAPSRRQ